MSELNRTHTNVENSAACRPGLIYLLCIVQRSLKPAQPESFLQEKEEHILGIAPPHMLLYDYGPRFINVT